MPKHSSDRESFVISSIIQSNRTVLNPFYNPRKSVEEYLEGILDTFIGNANNEFHVEDSIGVSSIQFYLRREKAKKALATELKVFINNHAECGESCEHLERYYEKIARLAMTTILKNGRRLASLPKININDSTKLIEKRLVGEKLHNRPLF